MTNIEAVFSGRIYISTKVNCTSTEEALAELSAKYKNATPIRILLTKSEKIAPLGHDLYKDKDHICPSKQ